MLDEGLLPLRGAALGRVGRGGGSSGRRDLPAEQRLHRVDTWHCGGGCRCRGRAGRARPEARQTCDGWRAAGPLWVGRVGSQSQDSTGRQADLGLGVRAGPKRRQAGTLASSNTSSGSSPGQTASKLRLLFLSEPTSGLAGPPEAGSCAHHPGSQCRTLAFETHVILHPQV